MFKKLFVLTLVLSLFVLTGCNSKGGILKPPASKDSSNTAQSGENKKEKMALNPLTGLYELEKGKENDRPVAVMINNLSIAQKVQTGLNAADIIYETEVEGGITRLMAVYQDISKVSQIGTIRSARYPYIDLAMGHNAFYIHHGTDGTYAKPHLKDTDAIQVDENIYGGKRVKNNLAREHTLYAMGAELYSSIEKNYDTANSNTAPWQNFADEDEDIIPGEQTANNVVAKFSNSYKTNFTYDSKTKLYTVDSRKDYLTGDGVTVKNVFILSTSIVSYPDGYHKKVDLTSGEGYYISNGYAQEIKWNKGGADEGFVFTDADGNYITVNAGKSWVCIKSKNYTATIS